MVGNEPLISVDLQDADGNNFSPNNAQETMMNVAVLLAISSIVKEKEAEAYPIIMDAPTSPLDDEKKRNFFKAMLNCTEQAIITSKDYILKNEKEQYYISDDFKEIEKSKAFWIRLEDNFIEEELHTINTLINEI